ncbi:unnamed protein product [Didymodactylos carnosus]|uniref:RNI-like protein n=1 Tax=Didymodactylos carnosus TaxID=1234261 RepID=A0A815SPK3_9BILA|nr:unnamed protein product [Didymodactylos carnosus]CAF4355295.1 unnamed protein product [Didymodactylos carnosus]
MRSVTRTSGGHSHRVLIIVLSSTRTDFLGMTGKRTLFSIQCHTGKVIQGHSHYPKEKEILLRPATSLQVIGKLNISVDVWMIDLIEVTPPFPFLQAASILIETKPLDAALLKSIDVKLPTTSLNPIYEKTFIAPLSGTGLALSTSSKNTTSVAPSDDVNMKLTVTHSSISTKIPVVSPKEAEMKLLDSSNSIKSKTLVIPLFKPKPPYPAEATNGITQSINDDDQPISFAGQHLTDKDMALVAKHVIEKRTGRWLDLEDGSITSDGIKCIAKALGTDTRITQLHLHENRLGDEGARILCDALSSNRTITVLGLSSNTLSDAACFHIGNFLRVSCTLISLMLGQNRIGDRGIRLLVDGLMKNTSLSRLYLNNTLLSDASIDTLLRLIKSTSAPLVKIDLIGTHLSHSGRERLKTETAKINNQIELIFNTK